MANTDQMDNPMILPDDLPRPLDDGDAAHLIGMQMPALSFHSTLGEIVDLSTLPGRAVVYAYPMTGVPYVNLPAGWDDIPGARGCTSQTLSFQAENEVFAAFDTSIFGVSTQSTDYQMELSDRLGLTFPILSDAEFKLVDALCLPTMTVEGKRLIKRLTLIIKDGTIEHVFYPVFPANRAAAEVIAWLQDNTVSAQGAHVLIYTLPGCPYCQEAKRLLTEQGIVFIEVDVERDPQAVNVMVARSSGRRTVPQIFFGSTHIGGNDELQKLSQSGQLTEILDRMTD